MGTTQIIIIVVLGVTALAGQLASGLSRGSSNKATLITVLGIVAITTLVMVVTFQTLEVNKLQSSHPCPTLEPVEGVVYKIK